MSVDYLSILNQKGSGLNITQIVDSLVEADTIPKKNMLEEDKTTKQTLSYQKCTTICTTNLVMSKMYLLAACCAVSSKTQQKHIRHRTTLLELTGIVRTNKPNTFFWLLLLKTHTHTHTLTQKHGTSQN